MLIRKTVKEFIDDVASDSPAPGGGSVSALAAALGAALTSMVCNLTVGKKKYAGVQGEIEQVLEKNEKLRQQFTAVVDQDTEAFDKVMSAYGLPKDSDEQKAKRNLALQEATKVATLIPLRLVRLCAEGIELARIVAEKGNRNSVSDAGVAGLLLQAAAQGGILNVRINLKVLNDEEFRAETAQECFALASRIDDCASEIQQITEKELRGEGVE